MTEIQGFQSKLADITSQFITTTACIYGPSKIKKNSIVDSFVIIGYPTRAKIQKILSQQRKRSSVESLFDEISTGSMIGESNHIRPFTTIYETSSLEARVETGTNVVIREKCHIDSGSIIGSGTILDSGVSIGKNARIQSNNFIPPKITLGNNVFLGPGVRFANDTYPVSSKLATTIVEDNVIIGIGAIILAGIIIEEGAVIAAGSIVTKDVSSSSVMMGTPARHIMNREEYDQKQKQYEKSLE